MNTAGTPHPGDELLLRFLDGDLSPVEQVPLAEHVDKCAPCRHQLDRIRETLDTYQKFHGTLLKTAIPPPPKPWDRLEFRPAAPARPVWRWLAAAAAIAALFLLVRRFERAPGVRAAELLQKAGAAERSAPAGARTIRIAAGRYRLDRPARQPAGNPTADEAQLRRLFESAGYSWDDPLSAGAFSRWHDRLPSKNDSVAELPGTGAPAAYVIRTTSTASPISDASLTLRATDLHAVACTLRFAAETVEMTELPGETPTGRLPLPAAAEPGVPQSPATSAKPATPSDELQVIAALHRIGADLGEPVEVRREGPDVVVNVAGVGPRRQEEVKTALAGLAAVRLQFEPRETAGVRDVERRPAPQVDAADPLLSELRDASPNALSITELSDQLTDQTETLIARAYALRGLARRFPTEAAARMTPQEIAMLNVIVRDHADAIAVSTAALARLLSPVLPPMVVEPAITGFAWQDSTEAVLLDARRLDQALHPPATPGNLAARKSSAALALQDAGERLPALRKLGLQ